MHERTTVAVVAGDRHQFRVADRNPGDVLDRDGLPAQEMAELYRTLGEAAPGELRQAMHNLVKVPPGRRGSELERLRTGPVRVSGTAMRETLDRTREARALGAGLVETGGVPPADGDAGPVRAGLECAHLEGLGGDPEDRDDAGRLGPREAASAVTPWTCSTY